MVISEEWDKVGSGGISDFDVKELKSTTTTSTTQSIDNTKNYLIYLERNADKTMNYKAIIEKGSLSVISDTITSTGYATVSYQNGTLSITSTSNNNTIVIEYT